jgi:hypothetical protein
MHTEIKDVHLQVFFIVCSRFETEAPRLHILSRSRRAGANPLSPHIPSMNGFIGVLLVVLLCLCSVRQWNEAAFSYASLASS